MSEERSYVEGSKAVRAYMRAIEAADGLPPWARREEMARILAAAMNEANEAGFKAGRWM